MKNMTEGNISKNFIGFAIPIILAGILSQAYGIADSMVVGRLLGEQGLASVGSTAAIITVCSSIIWGLGTGIALYIAILYGSGDFSDMTASVKANLVLIFGFSVTISVSVLAFHKPIFNLFEISENIYDEAFRYFSVYMSGFAIFSFNGCCMFIINAMGNTSFPFKLSIYTCTVNIIGNIFCITVLGMGVEGAALASVVVAGTESVIYMVKFHREFKKLGVEKQKLKFNFKSIINAWKQGVPCMIQQLVMYLSSAGVQPVVNGLGSGAIAAYSVCLRIYSMNATFFQNSSKSLSNYCAQCIGSGRISLVKKGMKICFRQSFLLTVPVMVLFFIFREFVVSLFYTDAGGESAMYVIRYIILCMPFSIFQIVNNWLHNFYRGVMVPKITTLTTLFYSIVRVAVTYALVPVYGMDGIFFGFIISWIAEAVLGTVILISRKWKSTEYLYLERSELKRL